MLYWCAVIHDLRLLLVFGVVPESHTLYLQIWELDYPVGGAQADQLHRIA